MPAPSTGYATATISNPGSALTDFSLMVDLSRMPASWWADVDTSDGTRGRAYKDDGTTELGIDWIDFDNVAETGWARVLWSGTLAASGTQIVRIYPPNTANAAVAPSATFGSDNAYNADWAGYWPSGGGADRTSNGADLTMTGGPTVGGDTIKGFAATDYDGSSQYGATSAVDLAGAVEATIMAWLNADTTTASGAIAGQWGNSTGEKALVCVLQAANTVLGGVWTTAGSAFPTSVGTIADLADAMVALAFASGDQAVYIDGAADGTSTRTGSLQNVTPEPFGVAVQDPESAPIAFFDGSLAQVQSHTARRSADWILHEYDQTADQATFWGTWTWNAAAGGTILVHPGMTGGMAEMTGGLNA